MPKLLCDAMILSSAAARRQLETLDTLSQFLDCSELLPFLPTTERSTLEHYRSFRAVGGHLPPFFYRQKGYWQIADLRHTGNLP